MSESSGQLLLFDLENTSNGLVFETFEENTSSDLVLNTPTFNLLDKFSAIDITVDQRISETEAEYCKRQEMIFYETRDLLKKYLDEMTILHDKYNKKDSYRDREESFLYKYDDLNKVNDRITSIYKAFISRITGFFTGRHNVTLSSSEIEKKYDENSISYSIILDEIFEQLGGLSFKEKAVEEIKAASRNVVYNKTNIQITKNKLSISDLIYWDTSVIDESKSVRYDDKRVKPLFLALSHFMNDSVEMHYRLNEIYQAFYRGSKEYDIFSKYEIGIFNVESLKVFKNGKIEIVFSEHENAEAFKNEYLI